MAMAERVNGSLGVMKRFVQDERSRLAQNRSSCMGDNCVVDLVSSGGEEDDN